MIGCNRYWLIAGTLVLAGCGNTVDQSAATGGLGGAAIGAAAGGPIGAAIGLGAGAAAGTGVEVGQERGIIPPEPGDKATASASTASRGSADLRHAQMALRDDGLYDGPIDGISGPRTRHALAEYQRRQGLPQTARLDPATRGALQGEVAAMPSERRR